MARSPSGERFKARLEAKAVKTVAGKVDPATNPKAIDTEFAGITALSTYAGQLGHWGKSRLNGFYGKGVKLDRSERCIPKN